MLEFWFNAEEIWGSGKPEESELGDFLCTSSAGKLSGKGWSGIHFLLILS